MTDEEALQRVWKMAVRAKRRADRMDESGSRLRRDGSQKQGNGYTAIADGHRREAEALMRVVQLAKGHKL